MRSFFTFLLLCVAAVSGQGIEFVNPSANDGTPSSQYAIFAESSVLHIAWTAGTSSTPVSLVLFQINGTDLVYPFEYLLQNAVNVTSLDWTVRTNKNLALSNEFVLNIFYTGATSPTSVSGIFNISSDSVPPSPTTSTSSTLSTGTTTNTVSSSTPSTLSTGTSPTTVASASSSPTASPSPTSSSSGGLSTGAKIGIGVGVPIAVILGVALGYFIFRSQGRKKESSSALAATQYTSEQPEKYGSSVPQELPGGSRPADSSPYEIYTPEHR